MAEPDGAVKHELILLLKEYLYDETSKGKDGAKKGRNAIKEFGCPGIDVFGIAFVHCQRRIYMIK